MKVENSNYYCVNAKGETVSIPLVEIGLVGRYYNERVLQQYREKDSWTFSYRISKKLATELGEVTYLYSYHTNPFSLQVISRITRIKREKRADHTFNTLASRCE